MMYGIKNSTCLRVFTVYNKPVASKNILYS